MLLLNSSGLSVAAAEALVGVFVALVVLTAALDVLVELLLRR